MGRGMADLSTVADVLSILGAGAAIYGAWNTWAIRGEIASRTQLPKIFRNLSAHSDEMLPLLDENIYETDGARRTVLTLVHKMKSDVTQLGSYKTNPACGSSSVSLNQAIALYEQGPTRDGAWDVYNKNQALRQSIAHLVDERKIVG